MSDNFSVYVEIASYITPALAAVLSFLLKNHFDLKERVKVLEIELAANQRSDDLRETNTQKIWDAISEINNTLKALESDVRVLAERVSK